MAGRRLTGAITRDGDNFVVSVPERRGSRKRVTRSFADEAQAERYRAAAIAASATAAGTTEIRRGSKGTGMM